MSDILPAHHRPLRVRKVHSLRTFIWLAKGARDFARAPLVGLLHGALMAGFGALMLWLAWDRFWVLADAEGMLLGHDLCAADPVGQQLMRWQGRAALALVRTPADAALAQRIAQALPEAVCRASRG